MYKKDLILKLTRQGLTVKEISNKTNFSSRSIRSICFKYNIVINKFSRIEMTDELEQFLIGSLLGDGTFHSITGLSKNSRLCFGHCLKQKEYITWKYLFLSKYNLETPISVYTHKSNRYISGECSIITLRSIAHPIFTDYRKKYYDNGNKRVKYDLVKKLKPFGLAVWFMDDGNVTNYGFELNTQSFKQEEIEFLQKVLHDSFNLKTTWTKSGAIYILSQSREDFINIIKPYIIKSMNYKLIPYKFRGEVLYKQSELLED